MKRTNTGILRISRGGMIAAAYVALTYLSFFFGMSSGPIQFRISECLCILPIFMPEAVPGLIVGCFVSNILCGAGAFDIIFGTLATALGVILAYLCRRVKFLWVATIPTIAANALIVPISLSLIYGFPSFFYFMATVLLGEFVCAGVLGSVLGYGIKHSRINFKI